jgi:hypothetical protein
MLSVFIGLVSASASLLSCKELVRHPTSEYQPVWRVALGLVSAFGAFLAGIAARDVVQNLGLPLPLAHIDYGSGRVKRIYAKEGLGDDKSGDGPNILIAVTGSVASVKIPDLVEQFRCLSPSCRMRIISTVAGKRMLSKGKGYDPVAWKRFCQLGIEVLDDNDEWQVTFPLRILSTSSAPSLAHHRPV